MGKQTKKNKQTFMTKNWNLEPTWGPSLATHHRCHLFWMPLLHLCSHQHPFKKPMAFDKLSSNLWCQNLGFFHTSMPLSTYLLEASNVYSHCSFETTFSHRKKTPSHLPCQRCHHAKVLNMCWNGSIGTDAVLVH